MNIFKGPFHPHLENAIADEIRRFKSDDPLKPLLIVVTSDTLKRHLMKRLTLGHGLNLIHVAFLNFNQLAKTLCKENFNDDELSTQDDLFFEETLRRALNASVSGNTFSKFTFSDGGATALWQTLRDLKEGLFSAETGLQALKEGHFGRGAMRGILPGLFNLYETMTAGWRKQHILDYGDLALRAAEDVSGSAFLKQFPGIFYYGFYDLTQILIDLFHALTKHHPATLFFPSLKNQPAWAFSERFFEHHIEGLVTDSAQIIDLCASTALEKQPRYFDLFDEDAQTSPDDTGTTLRITNAFDHQDEVLFAAKEIVRLISDEDAAFHEIGVVARDMSPYLGTIQICFQKHAIPVSSACEAPLLRHPLAQAALHLSELPSADFPRARIIDFLASPFFKTEFFCENTTPADRDAWDMVSRSAKITQGLHSWRRLEHWAQEEEPPLAEAADRLWRTVSNLHADLNTLPLASSWEDYAARWEALLIKTLGFHPLDEADEAALEVDSEDHEINKGVLDVLRSLSGLDRVTKQVSRENFIAAFQRALSRATLPVTKKNIPGVSVMNVMQARGLSFRFLFLLGLNEGIFPRAIREDPLLQDSHRRVLETVLGYKAGEKLAGYDEEKLLLALTAGGAAQTLYASYHRTDGSGRPAAPSPYVNTLKKTFWGSSGSEKTENTLPRSIITRRNHAPFDRDDLSLPDELAVLLNLTSQSCDALLKHLSFPPEFYRHGQKALMQLEHDGPLTAFDGLMDGRGHWADLQKKGISPTGLETYAQCPFRYFAEKLLALKPADTPEDKTETANSDIGTLCHDILKRFYETCFTDSGGPLPAKPFEIGAQLRLIGHTCFAQFETETPPVYALHWEATKTRILEILEDVIEIDLAALARSGYRPSAFEVKGRQRLEDDWPEFTGRIDRLDFHPEEGKLRVIDYKVTFRKSYKRLEKNLLLSAIRGERLQAPVYLRLAEIFAEEWGEEDRQTTAVFYHIAPNWPDGPLVLSEFSENHWHGECGAALKATIDTLFEGLSAGRFFMKPGDACGFCDVRTLCRHHHLPSRQRIEADPGWQQHRALQKKDPPRIKKASA
ncbi:MAG: PD-(D/E)XK nuclease family protein [Nitrospiria bacterium]